MKPCKSFCVISLLAFALCLAMCSGPSGTANAEPRKNNFAGSRDKDRGSRRTQRDTDSQKPRQKEGGAEGTRLGQFIRQMGEDGIEGIALMNGIEDAHIEPPSHKKPTAESITKELTKNLGYTYQDCGQYYFLYPEAYAALAGLSVPELHPSLEGISAEIAFGADLRLFMVFAWLGQAAGKTIIADNLIASAECGELALGEVPLRAGLEAILKSARVTGFRLDSTEEYVFLSHPAAPSDKRSFLINAEVVSPEGRALLDKRVSLFLPAVPSAPGPIPHQIGAKPLSSVMRSLSSQLGVRIAIEKALKDLPVNPAVITDVSVQTALDLMIRQWPLTGVGYEVQSNRILICREGLSKMIAEKVAAEEAARKAAEEAAAKKAAEDAAAAQKAAEDAAAKKAAEDAAAVQKAAEEAAAKKAAEDAAAAQKAAEDAAAKKAAEDAAAKKAAEDAAAKKAAEDAAAKKAAEDAAAAQKAAEEAAAKKAAEDAAAAQKAAEDAAAKKAAEDAAAKKAAEDAAAKKAAEDAAAKKAAEDAAAAQKAAEDAAAKKAAEDAAAAQKAAEDAAAKKAAEDAAAAQQQPPAPAPEPTS